MLAKILTDEACQMVEFVLEPAAFPLGDVEKMILLGPLKQLSLDGGHRIVIRFTRGVVLNNENEALQSKGRISSIVVGIRQGVESFFTSLPSRNIPTSKFMSG